MTESLDVPQTRADFDALSDARAALQERAEQMAHNSPERMAARDQLHRMQIARRESGFMPYMEQTLADSIALLGDAMVKAAAQLDPSEQVATLQEAAQRVAKKLGKAMMTREQLERESRVKRAANEAARAAHVEAMRAAKAAKKAGAIAASAARRPRGPNTLTLPKRREQRA